MLMVEYDEELVRKYDQRDGKNEGLKEGKKEINELNLRLITDGRMEDLKKATLDQNYQEKLYREYFPDKPENEDE